MDYNGQRRCLVAVVIVLLYRTAGSTFSKQQELYSDLNANMDVLIRPVVNQSDTLNVMLKAQLINILSLNEKEQILSTTIALQLSWTYETLQWLPSLYEGTNVVRLLPSKTWLPDLTYMNSVGNIQEINRGDYMKVTVMYNGHAMYSTGGNIDTSCEIDITKYPFDTQICRIVIGKAFSTDAEVMIVPLLDKMNTDNYEQNGEWNLLDTNIRLHQQNPQVTIVYLELTLRRRALFYTMNIIIPLILLSAMNVLSFKLPTSSGERMGYCISLFLTFMILLNTIGEQIPKISISVSYLQLYVNIQLTLGVIITTLSMMVVRLANYEGDNCKQEWIKTWYNRFHCQCRKDQIGPLHDIENSPPESQTKQNTPEKLKNDQEKSGHHGKFAENVTETYQELDKLTAVKFVDKMCFRIFLAIYLIVTFVCMLAVIIA